MKQEKPMEDPFDRLMRSLDEPTIELRVGRPPEVFDPHAVEDNRTLLTAFTLPSGWLQAKAERQ